MKENRTTLVIAHRLSTIMNADEIFVMDDGQISEHGNAQELLKRQGAFMELMQTQQTGN